MRVYLFVELSLNKKVVLDICLERNFFLGFIVIELS